MMNPLTPTQIATQAAEAIKLYRVRSSDRPDRWLHGSRGFYTTTGTIYASHAGAKAGHTHYMTANKWRSTEPAEIVEYTCTETAKTPLPKSTQ